MPGEPTRSEVGRHHGRRCGGAANALRGTSRRRQRVEIGGREGTLVQAPDGAFVAMDFARGGGVDVAGYVREFGRIAADSAGDSVGSTTGTSVRVARSRR